MGAESADAIFFYVVDAQGPEAFTTGEGLLHPVGEAASATCGYQSHRDDCGTADAIELALPAARFRLVSFFRESLELLPRRERSFDMQALVDIVSFRFSFARALFRYKSLLTNLRTSVPLPDARARVEHDVG